MEKRFTLLILLLLRLADVHAQDPLFSQFTLNQLHYNPAFTGYAEDTRAFTAYRRQWGGLGIPYSTYYASADTYFAPCTGYQTKALSMGLGAQLLHDQRGPALSTNTFALSAAGHAYLSDQLRFSVGAQGGLISESFDPGSLTFVAQYQGGVDPLAQGGYSSFKADWAAGALIEYGEDDDDAPLFGLGVSMRHLGGKAATDDRYLQSLNVQMYYKIPFGGMVGRRGTADEWDLYRAIQPAVQFTRQGPTTQWEAGVNFIYSPLWLGLWVRGVPAPRRRDALVASGGWQFGNVLFQYSHDMTLFSSLSGYTRGSHEIGIRVFFDSYFCLDGGRVSSQRRNLRCKY